METKPQLSEKVIVKRALSKWNIEIFISNFAFQFSGVFVNGFVISAYLVEVLHATPAFVGIISALVMLPNMFMPFTSIVVQKLKKKKVFTATFLLIGRLIFLFALFIGYVLNMNGINPSTKWVVVGLCCFGSIFSSFTPAVNSWLSDLLPDNGRSQTLALRNIIINFGAVFGVFSASFILKFFGAKVAFPILFIVTLFLFLSSFIILINVYEPIQKEDTAKVDRSHLFKEAMHDKNFLSFIVVVLMSTFSVYMVVPFFPIFWLDYFKAPYDIVGYMTAGTTLMLVCGVFFWGKLMVVIGARLLSKITIAFLAIIPILWFVVPKNNYIIFMFFLAFLYSFVQGGWAISITSSGFSIADKSKSLIYISIYSGVAAFCQVLAPIVAGALAELYGVYKPFANRYVLPHPLMILFVCSTFLHIICLFIFPTYKIQREKGDLHLRHILFRLDFVFVFSRLANAAFLNSPIIAVDRKKLAQNIGDTKVPSAIPPLLKLLDDLDQDVRLSAIEAIGKIPGKSSKNILIDFYDKANLIEKYAVVKALANFEDGETEGLLLKIYVSKNTLMSAEAAYALAKRKSERAREVAIWKMTAEENHDEDDFLGHLAILASNKASEALPNILMRYKNMKSEKHKEYTLYYVAVILGAKNDYYQSRNQEGEVEIKKYIIKMVEALKDDKETRESKNVMRDISVMKKELVDIADREENISFAPYLEIILNILKRKLKPEVVEFLEYFLNKKALPSYEIEFTALSIKSLIGQKKELIKPMKVLKIVHNKIQDTKDLYE